MIAPASSRTHEPSDLSLKGLGIVLAIFVGAAALMHVSVAVLLGAWQAERPSAGAKIDPAGARQIRGWVAPAAELRSVREAQQSKLHGYGWVDRGRGIVRIPIERAMELIAQRESQRPTPQTPERGTIP